MGRKSREKRERKGKQRAKRVKPDEVIQYGPMMLARYGRYVEQQVNWDPDEFKKMRAHMPKVRQK